MTIGEKTVLAVGGTSGGTFLWGRSAEDIHGMLEYGTGIVAFICFALYLVLLIRRITMTNKIGKAEIESHKATAEARTEEANFYRNSINPKNDGEG